MYTRGYCVFEHIQQHDMPRIVETKFTDSQSKYIVVDCAFEMFCKKSILSNRKTGYLSVNKGYFPF